MSERRGVGEGRGGGCYWHNWTTNLTNIHIFDIRFFFLNKYFLNVSLYQTQAVMISFISNVGSIPVSPPAVIRSEQPTTTYSV